MIKILKISMLIMIFAFCSVSYVKISKVDPNIDVSLEVIAHSAIANAEGSASCKTTCDDGYEISVSDCQYCSAKINYYVKYYDSNDNLIDEEYCGSIA